MSILSRIKESKDYRKVKELCDLDDISMLMPIVGNNEKLLDVANKYLEEKGNHSLRLKMAAMQNNDWSMSIMINYDDKTGEINRFGNDHLNPLFVALLVDSDIAVRLLCNSGADANILSPDGDTPLGWCANNGKTACAEELLKKSEIDPNKQDRAGWSPLHMALQNANYSIVKMLLLRGADPNMETGDGYSPAAIGCSAIQRQFMSRSQEGLRRALMCMEALRIAGADFEKPLPQGLSAAEFLRRIGACK